MKTVRFSQLNYGDTFYIAGIKCLKVYNPYKYPDCRIINCMYADSSILTHCDEDAYVELHDPDDNTDVELPDSDNDANEDE